MYFEYKWANGQECGSSRLIPPFNLHLKKHRSIKYTTIFLIILSKLFWLTNCIVRVSAKVLLSSHSVLEFYWALSGSATRLFGIILISLILPNWAPDKHSFCRDIREISEIQMGWINEIQNAVKSRDTATLRHFLETISLLVVVF